MTRGPLLATEMDRNGRCLLNQTGGLPFKEHCCIKVYPGGPAAEMKCLFLVLKLVMGRTASHNRTSNCPVRSNPHHRSRNALVMSGVGDEGWPTSTKRSTRLAMFDSALA